MIIKLRKGGIVQWVKTTGAEMAMDRHIITLLW